jgi:hypothetical protein
VGRSRLEVRAETGQRPDAISDVLLLAAIDRAERHEQSEGAPRWVILEHLGLQVGSAANTGLLREPMKRLLDAGKITKANRHGHHVWGLTPAGRRSLSRLRTSGTSPVLPEAPQRRIWREARAKAAHEIRPARQQLRGMLKLAGALLRDDEANVEQWQQMGRDLAKQCSVIATATFSLREWEEPHDTRSDREVRRKHDLLRRSAR